MDACKNVRKESIFFSILHFHSGFRIALKHHASGSTKSNKSATLVFIPILINILGDFNCKESLTIEKMWNRNINLDI